MRCSEAHKLKSDPEQKPWVTRKIPALREIGWYEILDLPNAEILSNALLVASGRIDCKPLRCKRQIRETIGHPTPYCHDVPTFNFKQSFAILTWVGLFHSLFPLENYKHTQTGSIHCRMKACALVQS
jgi:hypothetical protein